MSAAGTLRIFLCTQRAVCNDMSGHFDQCLTWTMPGFILREGGKITRTYPRVFEVYEIVGHIVVCP